MTANARREEASPLGIEQFTTSVYAKDLDTGETLLAADPDVPLLPASNTKLVTAARAFADLGPTYRFETTVHANGEFHGTQLVGDLVLTGRGAPDLSQADLLTLASEVAANGIETVAGELVIDASAFDAESLGPGWTWDDGQFEYGAKSTPLAVERNTVDITIAHADGSIRVDASPTSEIVRFDIDVETGQTADLDVYKKRASEVIRVEGQVPAEETTIEASPVDDPMMHAASLFRDALEAHDVTLDGWIRIEGEAVETFNPPCAVVESAPLSEITRDMCWHSDNFAAEQLARTIALERDGQGSWPAWERYAMAFLEERGADAVRLRDGSGLSRYNLLSATSIVSVLEWCLEQPWSEAYRRSLPRTGLEGTVSSRLEGVEPTVRAKTGTLTGARALSGYVENDDSEPVVGFSCLFSNLTGEYERSATDHIDDVVREIISRAPLES